MTGLKYSTILEVTLKSGSVITEHHTNEKAAESSVRQMQRSGLEVQSVRVDRIADRGTPEGIVKGSETAYGSIK